MIQTIQKERRSRRFRKKDDQDDPENKTVKGPEPRERRSTDCIRVASELEFKHLTDF
jgi:hypothetical protein